VERPRREERDPRRAHGAALNDANGPAASDASAAHVQKGSATTPWLESLGAFWVKINNDWIFNLAGLLAYNFLMALFPILLLVLAALGVILQAISPGAQAQLQQSIVAALPGNTGAILVQSVAEHLKRSVGILLIVGLATAFIAGSRLFITLENCFGIVFRLRGRDPLHQNWMAGAMLLLYLVIVPVVFIASILPAGLIHVLDPRGRSPFGVLFSDGARLLVWLVAAIVFFGLTYTFVPHRPRRWRAWRYNWRGTLLAAGLAGLYELVFRVYQQVFLHADNYGSVAAFAIVILLFLYYLAFILLLGAEVNSWAAGQRETAADLPGILHAVQVHRTLRGAAGPTAGMAHEEMQHHKHSRMFRYAEAMVRRARAGHPFGLKLPRYRAMRQRQETTPEAPA
jgi:membrane protein